MILRFIKRIQKKRRQERFLQMHAVGEYTYGIPTVFRWKEKESLTIGKFCSISSGVEIFLGGEHRMDWVTTYPFSDFFEEANKIIGHPLSKGDVTIGNDVWIGYGAKILSGVKIGNGAVVGAFAVVTKDIPPYAVVAGNPARIIKYRFSSEQIEELLKIRWWDWPIERILKNVHILMSDDLTAFIGTWKEL